MDTPEKALERVLTSAPGTSPVVPADASKSPLTLRSLFFHPDSHPVVLDFALARSFGAEWIDWDADTIWDSVKDAFQAEISELSRAKVQTVKTLHLVDSPWNEWQVFEKVVQGLNNNLPRFDIMQMPDLPQLYAAVDMMATHWEKTDFSDEVKRYIASVVLHENVSFVTPPLDFVQMEISQPSYECLDCGNKDSALFHDKTCDTCTRRFAQDKSLDFQPHPEVAEKNLGRNVRISFKYDPDEVQARYNELHSSRANLKEDLVDVQVAKIFDAEDYMNMKRRQMVHQLTALKSWLGA